MLSVLQLGPYPPPHGGVQSNLVAIRNYLLRRGHRTGVINITRHKQPERDELYFPQGALATMRLLATLPYRIIHLHVGGTYPPRVMALSLICCWLPGRRAILTFHSGGFPSSPEGRAARKWSALGFVFRQFDHVIAVNAEIAAMMKDKYGVRADRVSTIRPDSFDPAAMSSELPAKLREFYKAHGPVLLTVGLLEPEYDLGLQIEAMADIRKRLPGAGLLIIGSGSLEAELRAKIAASPVAEHILLAGDVAHADTLRAIQQATALLRTTLYDGDAVSVREALWMGTPVIASDNGMRPEGVRLIPKENAAALKEEIYAVAAAGAGSERPEPRVFERGLEQVYAIYERLA